MEHFSGNGHTPGSPGNNAANGAGVSSANLVKSGGAGAFTEDVIKASAQVPVIVDFWAPWCQPCKKLGPLLEKLVRRADGLLRMVKINVDENAELAAQLRVRSIPAVFAFKNGQPVDGFVGEQSESQVVAFLKRLTGDAKAPLEQALEQAETALDSDDGDTAKTIFSQVLVADPANPAAIAGLIRCAIAAGDLSGARHLTTGLADSVTSKPQVASALSALELAEQSGACGNAEEFRQNLLRDENDHQARFGLAMALYGDSQSETAMDELLELVRRDKDWNDEAGRKQLVKIFDALGPTHPLCVSGRRRLSTVLFS